MNQNTRIRKYFIWLFWIAVWQAANMLIHNNIIFVGPVDMVKALLELVRDSSFWASIFSSFARISLGFLGAFVLSILLGCLAYAFPLIRELLEPVMLLIKSVPVASFVILALIWIGSHNLAVFTSFLVVVPMIYVNTLSGLEHTDRKLLEMALVFRIPLWKQVRHIYIPAVLPLSYQRMPDRPGHELEIRRGRRGNRHTGRFHRRTALLLQALSGYRRTVCLDLCHHNCQRCF